MAALRKPPLCWVKSAAREARRKHPEWPPRAWAAEGYRVAFLDKNPTYAGYVELPGGALV